MAYFFGIFLHIPIYDNIQESVMRNNGNYPDWRVKPEIRSVNPYLSDNNPVGIDFVFQLEHNDIDALRLIRDIDGYAG